MQDSLAPEIVASRAGRVTGLMVALAVVAAGLWSVALVVGVGSVPVIRGETSVSTVDSATPTDSTTTTTSTTSATLVDEVGPRAAYAMVSLPLVASLLVGILASLRPRTWSVVTAFVVVGILGTFNLLAMLTIGIFFVPATAALMVASLLMLARRVTPTSSSVA